MTEPIGIPVAQLPRVELDPATLTAMCDPEPTQAFSGGPEPELHCFDAVELALRAFATVAADPIVRVYVRRPVCFEGLLCPHELLDTATATGWTAAAAYTVALDWGTTHLLAPTPGIGAAWPELQAPVRSIERPAIPRAPKVVANRTPYPYCGWYEISPSTKIRDCFASAVLEGRRAEVIETGYGIEGEPYTIVYRFAGSGAIKTYVHVLETWRLVQGGLSLNPGGGWSFDAWSETSRRLP